LRHLSDRYHSLIHKFEISSIQPRRQLLPPWFGLELSRCRQEAMDNSHRYEAVQDDEDVKEALLDQPQSKRTLPTTPWWKTLLVVVLAYSAGFATCAAALGFFHDNAGHADVATSAFVSSTSSTSALLPTPTLEPVEEKVEDKVEVDEKPAESNPLDGIILDCGGNPEEARSKGCVYDVMMQDWVPEPCYDAILSERYLKEGNWTWYADGDAKTTIPDEEMRKGEHGGAWMSSSYHQRHCVFSWDKTIRALRNNKPISQELLSYDHVLHCAFGALSDQGVSDEGVGVRAPTNYAQCALYDTWRENWIPDKHSSTGDGSMDMGS